MVWGVMRCFNGPAVTRVDSVADGPITARYRFIKNAGLDNSKLRRQTVADIKYHV